VIADISGRAEQCQIEPLGGWVNGNVGHHPMSHLKAIEIKDDLSFEVPKEIISRS
jgi:hypothetical protein